MYGQSTWKQTTIRLYDFPQNKPLAETAWSSKEKIILTFLNRLKNHFEANGKQDGIYYFDPLQALKYSEPGCNFKIYGLKISLDFSEDFFFSFRTKAPFQSFYVLHILKKPELLIKVPKFVGLIK